MAKRTAASPPEDDFEPDDDLDDLNDDEIEQIDESPAIGGPPTGSAGMQYMGGRPVVPPMFAAFSSQPTVTSLSVFKLMDGKLVALGSVPAQATPRDFVRQFFNSMPKPGAQPVTFEVRACDIRGKPLGPAQYATFDSDHTDLQQLRQELSMAETKSASVSNIGVGGIDMNSPIFALMREQHNAANQQIENLRAQLEAERKALAEKAEQVVHDQIGIAAHTTKVTENLAQKFMEEERKRADRAALEARQAADLQISVMKELQQGSLAQTTSFAQQNLLMANQRIEEERQRREQERREAEEKARNEREALRAQQAADLERLKLEQMNHLERLRQAAEEDRQRRETLAREEREAREARLERERRYDEERRAEERKRREEDEAERRRRHELELEQIRTEREAIRIRAEKEIEMAREQAKLAHELQMARFNGNKGTDLESMLVKGASILGAVGIEPKDAVRKLLGAGEEAPPQEGSPAWLELAGMLLPKAIDAFGQIAREAMRTQALQAQAAQRAQLPPPVPAATLPGQQPQRAAAPVPAAGQADPAPAGAPAEAGGAPSTAPSGGGTNTEEIPPIVLENEKIARTKLREVVHKLANTPESEWLNTLMFYYASFDAISRFLRTPGMTVKKALMECGASEEFARKIIEAAGSFFPDDIVRY